MSERVDRNGLPTSADVAEAMGKLGVDRGALDDYRPAVGPISPPPLAGPASPSVAATVNAALSYLGSRVGRRRR